MNAKPNLNGNSPKSFQDAGRTLYDVANATSITMRDALCEITNGRNYQHLSPNSSARSDDLARIKKIIEALNDLQEIGIELDDAGDTK